FENVNPSYNNPGAIFDVANNRLRQYPTYQEGWNALIRQVNLNISRGLTLQEFFGGKPGVYPGYAPAAAHNNNPTNYANTVAKWLGVPANVPLAELSHQSAVTPNIPTGAVNPAVNMS